MTTKEVFDVLDKTFSERGLALAENAPEPIIIVPRELLREVCLKLRDDSELSFKSLTCLTGIELGGGLQVAYSLYSNKLRLHLNFKVKVTYEDATIPSITDIWPAADWHEREAFDMFGIRFDGHHDHRRILCADDWEGHPLRKDYQPPLFFHGIPVTVNVPGGASSPATRKEI